MSFFADKNPRYLLAILPAAAIVTATTVMQHVRATTWTATNQILNLFHWLVLAGIAVLLPLAASGPVIELHRVDDSPWYSVPFAVSAAAVAAVMIAAGLLLQRRSRCALVAATFVIMLYSQWIFMAGYSRTEAAVAQYRPLMQAVLSAAPDAEIYNAHPPGKRPPTDLGVYANREIVWIADPSKLTPGEHPRVLLVPQDKGTPDPTPLSGWTTLYKQQRGGDRMVGVPSAGQVLTDPAPIPRLCPMFTSTIRDRFPIIARYTQPGKAVMDLGCVDSRPARHDAVARIEYKANLLHKRIAELNKEVLGVDIDPEGVKVLNSQGYNTMVADVMSMDLGRQFDTIVAGEIIEHLENPGLFLRNMRRHLKSDGVIIISTPNPFYAGSSWKIWRYGIPAVHEDHMGWQDPITLDQLLRRTGFEPFDGYWIQPAPAIFKTWKRMLRPYFSHTFMRLARPK